MFPPALRPGAHSPNRQRTFSANHHTQVSSSDHAAAFQLSLYISKLDYNIRIITILCKSQILRHAKSRSGAIAKLPHQNHKAISNRKPFFNVLPKSTLVRKRVGDQRIPTGKRNYHALYVCSALWQCIEYCILLYCQEGAPTNSRQGELVDVIYPADRRCHRCRRLCSRDAWTVALYRCRYSAAYKHIYIKLLYCYWHSSSPLYTETISLLWVIFAKFSASTLDCKPGKHKNVVKFDSAWWPNSPAVNRESTASFLTSNQPCRSTEFTYLRKTVSDIISTVG